MARISQVEIFKADIPLKSAFKHSLKKRTISESIFVKIELDNKITGFGESLPRPYVTGNTQGMVFDSLTAFSPRLIGVEIKDQDASTRFIKNIQITEAEARCATEIAFLDCLGKVFTKPVYELLGGPQETKFVYSAVISGEAPLKVALISLLAKRHKCEFVKLKVGLKNDFLRLRLCRSLLKAVDLRVDANGAWDKYKALEMIEKFRKFNISCIEQPTPKNDFTCLKEVADACDEPIIADESVCTKADALKLAQMKACDMFNIRLSKCGGIFGSLDIIKIAQDYNIGFQIGCHVGETGVLSAAGRHLAGAVNGFKFLEGSYARFILKEDIIVEDLTPKNSIARALTNPGLGVTIKEEVLRKYTKKSQLIK
ncbi:MAG: enolase C-terminal domain-like protein [Candidatus Omnitrophota bacterium]